MNVMDQYTNAAAIRFVKGANSAFSFRSLMFVQIPLLWFSKIKVHQFNRTSCVVKLPYRWRTQNPFRSVYFAAQCMAAELSTGLLMMAETMETGKKCSMLVTDMKATFTKKADEDVLFTCTPGDIILNAVALSIKTNEPVKIKLISEGKMANGAVVASFEFEWSLKFKS